MRFTVPRNPLFYHILFGVFLLGYIYYAGTIITKLELQSWDEAHNVQSAYEMQESGDWIGITFHGKLDHWDIKPPLLTWMMAISIKIFGFSEWAVRIPTMIFGISTLILIYSFLSTVTRNHPIAFMCAVGLALPVGFFGQHGMTTADYDMGIVFFNTLSTIAIFKIVFNEDMRWWYILGVSLGLGFMTKSLMAFIPLTFFLPALSVTHKFSEVIKWKKALVSLLILLGVSLPYLIIREAKFHENYAWLLYYVDIYRKIKEPVEAHTGGWDFYFVTLSYVFKIGVKVFYGCIIMVLLTGFILKRTIDDRYRTFIYFLICIVFYLLIFTTARTKAAWYIYPVIPLMVIFCGLTFMDFTKRKYIILVMAFATFIFARQVRLLDLYNKDRIGRNYENMTKNLILPNKNIFENKIVLSADTLMPSAMTYIDIYTHGKHKNFLNYDDFNRSLDSGMLYDLLIVSDTTLIKGTDRLKKITSNGVMALYSK